MTTNSDTLGNIYSISDNYYYEDYGVSNKFGFSLNGEYKDSSGIIHLRNRAYLPKYVMFLQLDDYTGTLENTTSQNRKTFANNNPYRFYDKTGNNAEEVRTTAQANQNQSGYDIDYVQPVFTAQEEPEGTGDPISAYSGDAALGGNDTKRVAIAFVMGYIMLGIWKFRDVLNAIVEGRIEITCPIGYQLTLNTYELQ